MAACRQSGCAACHILGLPPSAHCGAMEYNHRLHSGQRTGHRWGYCLGKFHHQGFALRGYSLDEMRAKYGPNLRDDKGAFHASFGTDQALQNDQDDRIGVPREEMPGKRALREKFGPRSNRKPSATQASSKTCPRDMGRKYP